MPFIDKDLLLKDISESVVFSVRSGKPSLELKGALKIIDRIENAPSADVVEVVMCKDCKHGWWNQDTLFGRCVDFCDLNGLRIEKDHFCSYGTRRNT